MHFPAQWPTPSYSKLTGRFIELVPTVPSRDSLELFIAGHATEEARSLWRFMASPGPFSSETAFRSYLEALEGRTDWQPYTVRRDGNAVGMISVMRIEPRDGCAELGSIWYAPSVQRTDTNTEANYLLLKLLFEEHGYRRVEWKCDSRNEPSRRAAERLGFTYEGLFRQHMIVKGQSRDTCWFSMLDQEWPEKKENFEHWLYEDRSVALSTLNAK